MQKGILFLEDDRAQLVIYMQIAKRYLAEHPVHFTQTVPEADAILKNNEIGVAVIDLMIPRENGADLIMKMKASDDYKGVKILVVSSAEKNSLIYDSLSAYIDGFITKPIGNEDLAEVLLNMAK